MAEILIQWTSPNAARYAGEPSLRRRGDIRAVGPNNHTWGRQEDLRRWVAERSAGWTPSVDPGPMVDRFGNPRPFIPAIEPDWTVGFNDNYRIIRVQGISLPNMRKLERRHRRAAVQGDPEFGSEDPFVEEHRYAWRINIRELPAPKRNALRDDGYVQITKNQFLNATVHKGLNVSFLDSHPDGYGGPRLPGTVD